MLSCADVVSWFEGDGAGCVTTADVVSDSTSNDPPADDMMGRIHMSCVKSSYRSLAHVKSRGFELVISHASGLV